MNPQSRIPLLFNQPNGWQAPEYAVLLIALVFTYALCHAAGLI